MACGLAWGQKIEIYNSVSVFRLSPRLRIAYCVLRKSPLNTQYAIKNDGENFMTLTNLQSLIFLGYQQTLASNTLGVLEQGHPVAGGVGELGDGANAGDFRGWH